MNNNNTDRIHFQRSCRLVLNYQHDAACAINPRVRQAQEKGGIFAPYRSCAYYFG